MSIVDRLLALASGSLASVIIAQGDKPKSSGIG
jgi:hypothetical protein